MSKEVCQRCRDEDYDRRTLWMACLYEMGELNIPFERAEFTLEDKSQRGFYTLRVCKDCRADWIGAIKSWFETTPQKSSPSTGIFIRINGANVEITEEEWNSLYPGRTPVRVVNAPFGRENP